MGSYKKAVKMRGTATFLLLFIPLALGYPKVKFQVPDPNGNKIINGSPAELGQFPWLSWLRIGGSWCSSSLIRPNWVLTAAHCINPDTTLYEALPGVGDLDPEPGTAVTVTGWGKELDDNNGVYPDQLMYSQASVVITNAECEEVYGSL